MDYSTPGLPGMGIAKLLLNSIGVPGRLGIPVTSNAHNSNYTLSLRIILLIPKCKIFKNRRGRRHWTGQVGVWGRPRKTNKNWIPSLWRTTRQGLSFQKLAGSDIQILPKGPTFQSHHPNSCEGLSHKTKPQGKVVNTGASFSFQEEWAWTRRSPFPLGSQGYLLTSTGSAGWAPEWAAEPRPGLFWEMAPSQWPSGFLFIPLLKC